MKITDLIAKFVKDGLAKLDKDEKELLKENKELLSPAQAIKYEKELESGEEEESEEEETEEEETEEEESGQEETEEEETEPGEESGVDEKALKVLIAKGVKDTIASQVDKISDQLVNKFMKGVKTNRKKVLSKGKSNSKGNVLIKDFFTALLDKDLAKAKALTTDVEGDSPDDANSGVLIPEELRTEVLRIAETQYGLARRDMLYLPFTGPGNTRKIPTLGSSVTVNWVNEKGKKPATQPTFALVEQTLKKLAATVPFTEEILEDSAVNLTSLISLLIAEAISKEEDLQFFTGVGTPWTGILNNGSVNVVGLVVGTTIDDMTADDLLNMQDATPSGALPGAKYYMNRTVFNKIRQLKDSNDDYIYQRPSASQPGTIWDYPYELSDAFPRAADVDTDDPFILYGNLRQGAVFGDKQQIRVKMLDQATITDTDGETTINLAEQDMVALRFVERVGYVAALPEALTVLKLTPESQIESPES